jgi:hypothetical protein
VVVGRSCLGRLNENVEVLVDCYIDNGVFKYDARVLVSITMLFCTKDLSLLCRLYLPPTNFPQHPCSYFCIFMESPT